MNNQGGKKLALLVVAFALIMVVAVFAYNSLSQRYLDRQQNASTSEAVSSSEEQSASASIEVPLAPDFTVEDLDGNTVKLSDYRGAPVVLNFWASWCGPCKAEMPHFQKLKDEYEGQVVFLMINLTDGSRETKETALAFIEEGGYDFNVLFDTKGEAAYSYRISSIPTTYFINAEGYALSREIGSLAEQTLRSRVETLVPAK